MGKVSDTVNQNDYENIVKSNSFGVMFFDSEYRLRRVSNTFAKLGINEEHVGMLVDELPREGLYPKFASDVRKMENRAKDIYREHISALGSWAIIISPYWTAKGVQEGVTVVTFDISKQVDNEIKTKAILKNMAVAMFFGVYNGRSLVPKSTSDDLYNMLGYTKKEYLQAVKNYGLYCSFQSLYLQLLALARALQDGEPSPSTEFFLRKKDGSIIWLEGRAEIISDSADALFIRYIFINITELHEERERLRRERNRLSYFLEMTADLFFEYSIEKDQMVYNNQDKMDGMDTVVDRYLYSLQLPGNTHADDDEVVSAYCRAMQGGKKNIRYAFRKLSHDNKYHWFRIEGRTTFDEAGNPIKVVGRIQNIDEDKAKEEELLRTSERDSLTGLYNHMVCVDKIKKAMKHLTGNDEGYLAIIDVDNFKKINDDNGHLYGDAVLCALSDAIKANFPDAIKGRIGGDEFLIYVYDMSLGEFKKSISAVLRELTKLGSQGQNKSSLSCSIGVAICTALENDYEKAFKVADQALYLIKNTGKNSYTICHCGEGALDDVHGYYLEKEPENDYIKDETLIGNDDELVMFAMELLTNLSSFRSSLGIIADRVCSYLDFDGMLLVNSNADSFEMGFDWTNDKSHPFDRKVFPKNQQRGWQGIEAMFDGSREAIVVDSQMMRKLRIKGYKSALVVRAMSSGNEIHYMAYLNSKGDKKWSNETPVLLRLTHLLVGKIVAMQTEERNRAEIEYRMNYDELTGLPSYTRFLEQTGEFLEKHGNDTDKVFYICYADFVNFKYVNELYGYSTGDRIIELTGKRLLRASKRCILSSRVTADQFVVLMEARPDEDPGKIILHSFEQFNQVVAMRYPLCKLTVLCGLYKVVEPDIGVSVMVDRANAARKYGKEKGENGCILYTREMWEQNEDAKEVYVNIIDALKNREFQVYLQPKISLKTGKIVGAESLVRWRRPDGTLFPPDRFIPVLEKNGFITKVDFYVLEETLRYQREIINLGIEPIPISVNFSRVHYDDPKFVETIMNYLENYDVDPGLLEAEITEYNYLHDIKSLNPAIIEMQKRGVLVSIDDFGSGYSSLNILSRVTADIIKLDRLFLQDMEDQKEFLVLLTEMINKLGYQIIMEGVETEEQMRFIASTKCDMVQGYYVAKPMPMDVFKKFVVEYNSMAKPWR